MRLSHVHASTAFFLAALGGAAFSSGLTSGDTAGPVRAASRANELLRLRTRDGDVAVLAGTGGRRVTIYDASGAPIRSADVEALRATDPALYQILNEATASRGYLDATMAPRLETKSSSVLPAGDPAGSYDRPIK